MVIITMRVGVDDDHNWSTSSAAYPNLEELPTFIIRQRESAQQRPFTTTADPVCVQGKQLATYNLVKSHLESNNTTPFRMIVSGAAGTGKSYLIHCPLPEAPPPEEGSCCGSHWSGSIHY